MKINTLSLAMSLALGANAFVVAQESNDELERDFSEVERIRITADIAQRNLSELPASVIVLDNQVLEEREARHLQDVIAALPNVNVTAGASRGRFFQIRGIGERSQFSEPSNPSVGLLLDDLDISGLGSLATIFDVQQVELLSGPQSIASGINSLAGVIKIVSNDADAEGSFSASAAEFGEFQLSAAKSFALSENLSLRGSIQQTSSDGFVRNEFLGRDDTNGIDEFTGTLALDYQLSEDSSLSAKYYRFDIDNGYDAFSLDNDNVTQSDQPGFDRADANALSLKYSAAIGGKLLQATVSQLDGEFDYAFDEDWTFTGFHPFGYTSFDRYLRDIERTNASVKLGSDFGEENPWLVGLSYYRNQEDLLREYTFNDGDFTSEFDPTTVSIFGQYEWQLPNNFTLLSAARLENYTADYADNDGFTESLDDTLFAGSLALQYKLNDNLIYASLSRGYRAGGFNIDQRLSGENRTFDPEFNWNTEVGIRGQAFDGKADIAVNVFYMSREDAQVNDFATFPQTNEDGSVITSFADAIRNTDTGTNKGVELSSSWYLNPKWTMKFNAGYLRATFGNYTRLDGSFVPRQDQAQAPKFTAYLSSDYQLTDKLKVFFDIDAKDEFRFSDGHNELAPFTLVVNSRVTYALPIGELSVWVRNMFDRQIFTRGFAFS